MNTLTFTTEPPTKAGQYYVLIPGRQEGLAEIHKNNHGRMLLDGWDGVALGSWTVDALIAARPNIQWLRIPPADELVAIGERNGEDGEGAGCGAQCTCPMCEALTAIQEVRKA